MTEFTPTNTSTLMTYENVRDLVNPPLRNAPVNPANFAWIHWQTAEDKDWESQIQTYRDYYEGEHKYELTDRMREFLELDANVKFILNYVPIPLDTLEERLHISGFDAGEYGGDNNAEEPGIIAQWWKANNMEVRQKDTHHAALRDRDAYILTEWDNENNRPKWSLEEEYDGTYGIKVVYDGHDPDKIKYAVKRWPIEDDPTAGATMRLNIYTPDAVYKYQMNRKAQWEPYTEEGQDWPIAWTDDSNAPIGVTISHFKCKKSELHDVIPVQDALSKAVIDELAGADTEGFSMLTLSGGPAPDPDMTIGPRRILHAQGGQWGSIPAGNLAALSAIVTNYIMRMAQISRTPLSYFQITGQVTSDATQKAHDSPLVSKANDRSIYFGESWENAIEHAAKLDRIFGDGVIPEDQSITAVWSSFERSDKQESDHKDAEIAKIKSAVFVELINAGVGREAAAKAAGYDDETAAKMAENGGRVLARDMVEPPQLPDGQGDVKTDGLNGAQIRAILDVLANVRQGSTPVHTARELIIAVGVSEPRADVILKGIKLGGPEIVTAG